MRLIDADKIPWDVEGVGTIPVVTKEEIDKMPAVDAQPIKEGHWKVHERAYLENNAFYRDLYECSICGVMNKEETHYCPWCGAKMKDEEE